MKFRFIFLVLLFVLSGCSQKEVETESNLSEEAMIEKILFGDLVAPPINSTVNTSIVDVTPLDSRVREIDLIDEYDKTTDNDFQRKTIIRKDNVTGELYSVISGPIQVEPYNQTTYFEKDGKIIQTETTASISGMSIDSEVKKAEKEVKYTNFLHPEVIINYFEYKDGILKPKNQTTNINKLNLIGKIIERQQGIKKIEISLNKKVIKTVETKNEKVYPLNEKIELQKGENEISILAYSIDGIKNIPQIINLNYQDVINKGDSFYVVKKIKEWLKDSRDFAILIGVKDYPKESGYDMLPYALRDIDEIKETLVKDFNFDEDNIFTLYNEKATKYNIETLLTETITNKINEKDRLFIFFSGHGYQRDMKNGEKSAYIVPYGVQNKTNYSNMIDLDQIVNNHYFKYINAKQILIVLDSCYSGNIVNLTNKSSNLEDDTIDLLKDKLSLDGRHIITAGSSGQDTMMGSK